MCWGGWDRYRIGVEVSLAVVQRGVDSIKGAGRIRLWLTRLAISATVAALRRPTVDIAGREEANPFCSRPRYQLC